MENGHEYIKESIMSRSRNVVFPDTTVNAGRFDSALYRGTTPLNRLQCVGALIYGGFFLVFGIVLIVAAMVPGKTDANWRTLAIDAASRIVSLAFGALIGIFGLRVTRNALLTRRHSRR